MLRHVENKEVIGESGILKWSYNAGGSGKNNWCHLPGLVSLCWWHPQNLRLHQDLSVLEASSFPLSRCEMQKHTEFYLIKFGQTGQMVTEMQSKVPCGISKSSAIHFSVQHTHELLELISEAG